MHPALKHHSHLLIVMTSSHVSVLSISCSFSLAHSLRCRFSSHQKEGRFEGKHGWISEGETHGAVLLSAGLRGTKCTTFVCVRDKSIHQFSIWFPFPLLPYFFIWRVYCFFMELLLIISIFPCLILCPKFVVLFFCFFTRNRLVQCPLQTPD